MGKYETLAKEIIKGVGGKENISELFHCMTRLRFKLKNESIANDEFLKKVKGVITIAKSGGQYQVVIGNHVGEVYSDICNITGIINVKSSNDTSVQEKKNILNTILDTLIGIFSPIITIIIGAGMIKGLLSLLSLFKIIDTGGNLYYFLNFIGDASYYFLPVFLAASASKKFNCNMYIAILMAAILLHPNFAALKNQGSEVFVLNIPVKIVTYSSTVIPIILIVWVLSYVEKLADKIIPSVIKFVARPLFIILVMSPIAFCILGPLGSFLGDILVSILLKAEENVPWLLPTIIGAFMPFLVMAGMHLSLIPAYVNSLSALGYETLIGPGNFPSNIAQGAAALCVAVKTKNKELRQIAISSGFTALLGITEPALFSVNLRLKKPLIAIIIGGAIGGLYAGIVDTKRYGGGGAGLATIGLFIGDDPNNVINVLISGAIAFVITFAVQFYLGFEDIKEDSKDDETENDNVIKDVVYSPVNGKSINLSEVSDKVFSNEVIGKTVAIEPDIGKIYAPFDGTITSLFSTNHAIGLESNNGTELLIHIGVDTVKLDGKYFKSNFKEGDKIKLGDVLIEFDKDSIKNEGYETVVNVIITNSDKFLDIIVNDENKNIENKDTIFTLIK